MKLYNYDPSTKEYVSTTDAFPDSANPNKPTIPAHATTIPVPAFQKFEAAVFAGNNWSVVPDYRGFDFWDTVTGQPIPNDLKIGEAIPAGLTMLDPTVFAFAMWDGNRWIRDDTAANEAQFMRLYEPAFDELEMVMRVLVDNEARHKVVGMTVLSSADLKQVEQHAAEMSAYVEKLNHVRNGGAAAFSIGFPHWPLNFNPDDPRIFTEVINAVVMKQAAFGTSGKSFTVSKWTPNSQFYASDFIYGPGNEGLYVALTDFISGQQLADDVTNNHLAPILINEPQLRGKPVASTAQLTALLAHDFELRKVLNVDTEYVFSKGAHTGMIADDANTGYWNATHTGSVEMVIFDGVVAGASQSDILVANNLHPTNILLFINGDAPPTTDFSYDDNSGMITLGSAMSENDTWKVVLFS
jgi:hypothetical protein